MTMGNDRTYYSANELLEIFREQHRLCSPLDPMADESFVLTRETKIFEWRDAQDLLPWQQLADFLNQEFRISITRSEWKRILTPDDKRTLGDVCDFLSTVAERNVITPVKRLGADCLSAAVFLTLKGNLKGKGVDVSELRPSTPIEPFLEKNFSPLVEEVTLLGVKAFDTIGYGQMARDRRFKYWIDKLFPRWNYRRPLKTGGLHTFRDLVDKILEDNKLGV